MNTSIFKALLLCGVIAISSSCGRDDVEAPAIPASDGSKLKLEGGEGAGDAANAVYVDFSADKQNSVVRSSWTLGFYGGNEFRVAANGFANAGAAATTSTDINAVNSTNFDINTLTVSQNALSAESFKLFDDTLGRITHTAIAEVSATAASNRVYVINPATGAQVSKENLWKIRVQREGSTGYKLEYAKLDDTNVQTITINKNADFNFTFFSFTQGVVNVEPKKSDWDISWGKHAYFTAFGPANYVPYTFGDLVFLNHLAGTQAAQAVVSTSFTTTYEQFNESHLGSIQLSNNRNTVGSTWRATTGSNAGIFPEKYYIIKDSANNIYKLKFVAMGLGSDGGTRGYPEIEYKLVKRG